jgi:Zn-dependent protease with chaperone function
MAQSRDQYIALIKRLEQTARDSFAQYKLKIVGLAIAGYAYVWAVLALLCVLACTLFLVLLKAPFLAIKLGLPMLLVIGVILRSFWVKFEPVQGTYLSPREAPEVFRTVEEIRGKIGAPKVHALVLVPEFNAAIVQRPRLGLLGWYKNHLLIGMELVQALPYNQFRSVLAHEMGHLSGNHGKFSAWVYGARAVWLQLLSRLSEEHSFATLLFRKFFAWFVPYFDAYTFVLARRQEYEADLCALEVEGKDTAAFALINTKVRAEYSRVKYWPAVLKKASDLDVPPANAYTDLGHSVRTDVKNRDAEVWLSRALLQRTDYNDTHPCLTDRLAAMLNLPAEDCRQYAESILDKVLMPEAPAAERLFGDKLEAFVARMNNEWAQAMLPYWQIRHQAWQIVKEELEELEEKQAKSQLSDDELKSLACRNAQVKGFREAEPLFQKAFEEFPDDADLHYVYGDWLVDENDGECVRYLERAMELDRAKGLDCCQLIYGYLKSEGSDERAEKYARLAEEFYEELLESQRERSTLTKTDVLEDNGLEESRIEELVEQVRSFRDVKKAFFVRKQVRLFPERPFYLLIVEPAWHLMKDADADQKLVSKISEQVQFPGETLIMTRSLVPAELQRTLDRLPGSRIYPPGS